MLTSRGRPLGVSSLLYPELSELAVEYGWYSVTTCWTNEEGYMVQDVLFWAALGQITGQN